MSDVVHEAAQGPNESATACRAAFLTLRAGVIALEGEGGWRARLIAEATTHMMALGVAMADIRALDWPREPLEHLEADVLGFRVLDALGAKPLLRQELDSGRHDA